MASAVRCLWCCARCSGGLLLLLFAAGVVRVQALTVAPAGTPTTGALRTSMAMVEGRPAVVWSDRTSLKYARALDTHGTAWGEPVTLNPGPGLGAYVSLRI